MPPLAHVWTDGRGRAGSATTTLRVEGLGGLGQLVAPTSELKGWDGYMIELYGYPVAEPADGAPWWTWETDHSCVTLELRYAGAWHPPAPMLALIQWAPGAPIDKSIKITADTWGDDDLKAAGYALRRLHGLVSRRGHRRRLEQEPWEYWREQADKAIELRAKGYTWPDIRKRMKIPTRTLQTWVTRRQAERG